jgi:outer membrane biosynthesis protein TonB
VVAAFAAVLSLTLFASPALGQDPVPTEPVVTEPTPTPPVPDPAPDPPPAAVTPKPKPKQKPVQRPAAPSVSRPPSTPQPRVVVPARSQPAVQRPARPIPRAKPVTRRKPRVKATKQERSTRTVRAAGAVAGATSSLPQVSSTVPSDLASVAVDTPSSQGPPGSTSLLLASLIALALALAALASIPNRQLAVFPATRWIVKRRLDLVIGGMGALATLLGVLFISAVFGP